MTTVLLIEDARDLAQVLVRELHAAGYHALHVADGLTALDLHARAQPALVILDWMLPGLPPLEIDRLDLRCVPTDVGLVVQHAVETIAPLAWQAGNIQVVAQVAADVPAALVDAGRLEQVVQNLLHNAVRHTPPGGVVAVVATADATAVVLEVEDTGEGIAPADLPRIWERFYRTQDTYTRPGGGTGLGLALVKELTEAMGGSVGVQSRLGEGTCFRIRLPLREDPT